MSKIQCDTCGDYIETESAVTCSGCGATVCQGCADQSNGLCGNCYSEMNYSN